MSDKPDLDLIRRVQQARAELDAQAQPSRIAAVYWIEAKRQMAGSPPTPRAGHWLIQTTIQQVDAQWALVKAATEAGRLGYKSKVATAGRAHPDERVIHVMTYDADDADDVARVGDALRALGFPDITYHPPA
ncbi:MAG: DUF1917 domain-containing protein [Anaerolineae bacterium]|nr:DUF1917 domain-containing protein [Anaerolineae bacterium]